ncbi:MAG: NADPH-dependent 7-cyano-7-deazaguanine reductase QueF [Planctomycetes bacterium]|nr:NADPH-dependent 7-cyano-7-deazaguanine reductase QueF [Planctomycetota bacterium]
MAAYRRLARSGIDAKRPRLETFENQFAGYTVTLIDPEYNAICPKTGLPDFGTITISYGPDRKVIELKSFKMYMTSFRNVGIFYENAVNVILRDLVKACDPAWMTVTGEFNARGGIRSRVEAKYERPS